MKEFYFLTLIARFESAVFGVFTFTVLFFVAMWAIYAVEKENLWGLMSYPMYRY